MRRARCYQTKKKMQVAKQNIQNLLVKNSPANARDLRDVFDPWVGKIPWRREWQPTPVFLPGKSHGQRSLVGYRVSKTKLKRLSICFKETQNCVFYMPLKEGCRSEGMFTAPEYTPVSAVECFTSSFQLAFS